MTRFASRALTAVLGSAFVVFALPGCGGGAAPAAPTPPATVPTVSLQPGLYTLAVAPGTINQGPFQTSLCLTINNAPNEGAVAVRLERTESGFTGRALEGSLAFDLRPSGSGVAGTMRGSAPAIGGVVELVVRGEGGAFLSGTGEAENVVAGSLGGDVSFASAAGSHGCSAYTWRLAAR
ncbi:MAG: hypothetical protein EHM24_22160 [Acidobacteria bacterium]|nr:MAG: hypothetical protein EHM24_22160 [Acidobacteriota bacterium]